MKKPLRYITLLVFLAALSGALRAQTADHPKRELRGVWIATVANIDWPKSQGTNAEAQKKELLTILDRAVAYNLNCVVFQVRPTSDALYYSNYEPWSHWVTGKQGQVPAYDPLQFLITECGKRGLAVHAWVNPYRVWLDKANIQRAIDPQHPCLKYSDWVVAYGKTLMLHPGLEETRKYVCSVVADLVENYDIDAVHMDDYFYPYRIAGQEFPDDDAYRKDPRGLSKEDWRRDNVNRIVRELHDTIHSVKPWVEFGVSPFGVWRNASKDPANGSATRAGQTNYDDLYADILTWCREGWVDYIAPQIYWHIGHSLADYKTIAEWWNSHNYGTPLYIGHASYLIDPKSTNKSWQTPQEIVRQVALNRTLLNIHGSILYSANSLANDNFRNALTEKYYAQKAIWPENPRIDPVEPVTPSRAEAVREGGQWIFRWHSETNDRRFVLYRFPNRPGDDPFEDPQYIVRITTEEDLVFAATEINFEKYRYAITALSPSYQESLPTYILPR